MSRQTIGYICQCGERNKFSLYVFAHWQIPLIHTCPKCTMFADIKNGVAKIGRRKMLPILSGREK